MRQTRRYTGTRLFEVLAEQGRRQDWLAQRVGCSRSLISMIKSGQRPIPGWFAERASNVLGIPEAVLFFDPILSFDADNPSSDEEARVA